MSGAARPAGRAASRSLPALATTVVVLALWNLWLRPETPSRYTLGVNIALGFLFVGIGLWAGLGTEGLGLGTRRLRAGLLYGGVAFLVVVAALVIAAQIPTFHHYFENTRADVGLGRLWFEALVAIPLGTVFIEEVAFRGLLLGLLLQHLKVWRAVAVMSMLFGLWHLQPVVASTGGGAGRVAGAALGTFAFTTVAGVIFGWLRLRSGSLLAPALLHVGTNSAALVTAWYATH